MDRTEIAAFLAAAFPNDIPSGNHVLIWTLPDKTSHWANKRDALADVIARQAAANLDTYIGVGLAPKEYGPKARVKNNQVSGLFGLWADIDYADDVHSKKNLPTQEQALEFIGTLPHKPSLVLHSGHGYQAWWFFREIWKFPDAQHRDYASGIARAWIYRIRDLARAKKWDVDSTIDLARVLRVPGTENYKNKDDVKPVTIVEQNDGRFYPTDFAELNPPKQGALDGIEQPEPKATLEGVTFILDAKADPPASKWMALCDNDSRALKSWQRTRTDFNDQSASSYDMSLATIARYHGWNDQEIVNLIIASRRHHGDDLKLREDYYARTLARAAQRNGSAKDVDEEPQEQTEEEPGNTESTLQSLSGVFGVDIQKLTKFLGDPPTYMLTIGRNGHAQEVTLGEVKNVMTQRLFREKVASAVDIIIPKVSETVWERRAQALLSTREISDLGPESSPADTAEQWLREYLQSHKPSDEWAEAVVAGRPFIREGYTYVTLNKVTQWLKNSEGERISARELARAMKRAHWEQHTQFVAGIGDSAATTRSVWRKRLAGASPGPL